MSEPLVGPDAADIENPGPAFDGGEPAEVDPEGARVPPVSSLSGDTDENGTSEAEAVDNSGAEPEAAEPEAAEPEAAEVVEAEAAESAESVEPEPETDPETAPEPEPEPEP
ncbi:hypothetical protein, partial [Lentzea indica]|uniref:hypothetical protein n=1 Tax=Lentzea indica TaxID=2604800 RepID=UPI0035E4198D